MIELVPIELAIMLLGISFGLLAGMLPGVGNVVVLMLVYPFVTDYNLFQIVLLKLMKIIYLNLELFSQVLFVY